MQTLDDVARIALAFPGVTEGVDKHRKTSRTWAVLSGDGGGKGFAWERPFSKADIKRFGDEVPPEDPIVAVVTADLHEKEAILAAGNPAFFTIPHFNGYKAYLIQLDLVSPGDLREALTDGWLACAPPDLAEKFKVLLCCRTPRAISSPAVRTPAFPGKPRVHGDTDKVPENDTDAGEGPR